MTRKYLSSVSLGATLLRKKFAPFGRNFFPLRIDSISERFLIQGCLPVQIAAKSFRSIHLHKICMYYFLCPDYIAIKLYDLDWVCILFLTWK